MTSYEASSHERLLSVDRMFGQQRHCLKKRETETNNEGGCLDTIMGYAWYFPNLLWSFVSSPVPVEDGSNVLNARDDTGYVGKSSVDRMY